MIFKFVLSHDVLGSQQISEPNGWKDVVLKLDRHEDFHSLIEYFEGEFIFYGNNGRENGGVEFIREVESIYGFDTTLTITISLAPDNVTYQTIFIGQLDLSQIEEMPDNKIQVPIIRDDFWSKFINRLETEVELQSATSLDGDAIDQFDSVNLKLTAQKLRQKSISELSEGYLYAKEDDVDVGGGEYLQFSMDKIETDEIKERFDIPNSYNPEIPVWIYAFEFDGDYAIDLKIEISLLVLAGVIAQHYSYFSDGQDWIKCYYSINGGAEIELAHIDNNAGDKSTTYYLNTTLTIKKGDILRVYPYVVQNYLGGSDFNGRGFLLWGTNSHDVNIDDFLSASGNMDFGTPPSGSLRPTYLDIVADTTFTESNCPAFFLHDSFGCILDRVTNQNQSFYSELLGSENTVYRQYESRGCDADYVVIKGLQARLYSLIEKPFFQSFKKNWEGANPILNLGLGYETLNGDPILRIEGKKHFYDDSDVSVNISNVRDMVRKYDEQRLFKAIRIGYKKWQSENISGIDDPQTKQTRASRLQKSGKDITLESEFIAASLAIETTRRTTREKSADYKFDNEVFIVAVRPNPIDISPETSPDVVDFEPELDENFSDIENLLNAETRYNLGITSARNFERWKDYLSAGLQAYLTSTFKFVSGEGNYDLITNRINLSDGCDETYGSLSEKEDIDVSADPYHLALLFEITCPLDWDDYVLIRDNRKKAIGISQTDEDHVKFFIKDLEYSPVKGEVKLMAWPVELMSIRTIDTTTQMQICTPDVAICDDAYLTELGFELITESGDCLILD